MYHCAHGLTEIFHRGSCDRCDRHRNLDVDARAQPATTAPVALLRLIAEDASFRAADSGVSDNELLVDAAYVDAQLQALCADEDLSRFIL